MPSLAGATQSFAPPTITIDSVADGAAVPTYIEKFKGKVTNLQKGEMVWTFNSSNDEPNTIYSNVGPCPIDADGFWECDNLNLNSPGKYTLWAAVVTDKDAYRAANARDTPGHSLSGVAPPHVLNAIAKVGVTRQ